MSFPKDGNFTVVKIERLTGGSLDNSTGRWNDSVSQLVAEAEIDLQPKTGSKTLTGFIGIDDIMFSSGFSNIMQRDLIDQKYRVVNIEDWLTHYELELEHVSE